MRSIVLIVGAAAISYAVLLLVIYLVLEPALAPLMRTSLGETTFQVSLGAIMWVSFWTPFLILLRGWSMFRSRSAFGITIRLAWSLALSAVAAAFIYDTAVVAIIVRMAARPGASVVSQGALIAVFVLIAAAIELVLLVVWVAPKGDGMKYLHIPIVVLLVVAAIGGYFQHLYTCFTTREYGFLIGGAIAPPVGVIHGWGIWAGIW